MSGDLCRLAGVVSVLNFVVLGESMSLLVKKHFDLLGHKVKDKVTGLTGIATSLSFDLYGCVQVIINPGLTKDGKLGDQHWFDIARLEKVSKSRVMDAPDFDFGPVAEGRRGPAEKPFIQKP